MPGKLERGLPQPGRMPRADGFPARGPRPHGAVRARTAHGRAPLAAGCRVTLARSVHGHRFRHCGMLLRKGSTGTAPGNSGCVRIQASPTRLPRSWRHKPPPAIKPYPAEVSFSAQGIRSACVARILTCPDQVLEAPAIPTGGNPWLRMCPSYRKRQVLSSPRWPAGPGEGGTGTRPAAAPSVPGADEPGSAHDDPGGAQVPKAGLGTVPASDHRDDRMGVRAQVRYQDVEGAVHDRPERPARRAAQRAVRSAGRAAVQSAQPDRQAARPGVSGIRVPRPRGAPLLFARALGFTTARCTADVLQLRGANHGLGTPSPAAPDEVLRGQALPAFTPTGPALVLLGADELKRFTDLRRKLWVNGKLRQNVTAANMAHPCRCA